MSTTTTTPSFDLSSVRQDVLDAIKTGQDLTVDTFRTVAGVVQPLVQALPKAPFADLLPKPSDTLEAGYALAAEVLDAQRDFARRLAEVLAPAAS